MTRHFSTLWAALLTVGFTGLFVTKANAQAASNDRAQLDTEMSKLPFPPEPFQAPIDREPDPNTVSQFLQAYRAFKTPPFVARDPFAVWRPRIFPVPSFTGRHEAAPAATEDAASRQASIRTMLHIALREPRSTVRKLPPDRKPRPLECPYFQRCLIAIIIDQAPVYCHRFSPYLDRLPIAGLDLAPAADRPAFGAAAAAPGVNAIDPAGPLNHAALLQNGDAAIALTLVDALKKLQIEYGGTDLIASLSTSKPTPNGDVIRDIDPRAERLLLSVLADGEMQPDTFAIESYLINFPIQAVLPRFYLLQRVVPVTGEVTDEVMKEVLNRQLRDATDPGTILPVVLDRMRAVTSLRPIEDFSFLTNLAVYARDPRQGVEFRADCVETLAHFVGIVRNVRDETARNKLLDKFNTALSAHITKALNVVERSSDSDERLLALQFLTAVEPVVTRGVEVESALRILMVAFTDAKFYKAQPTSRLVILAYLKTLGTKANIGCVCTTIEGLLFSSTEAEQAAILDTIAVIRGLKKN